jgi:hypothetical protein
MQDPFAELEEEFDEADLTAHGDDRDRRPYRLRDQAQDAIAHLTGLSTNDLFDSVPDSGFKIGDLRLRFDGTAWEPLLWAAPWLWRLSGNDFLDLCLEADQPDTEPWSRSTVFRLTATYREAMRVMKAVDGFDTWLTRSPVGCVRDAVEAAVAPLSGRWPTLLELPVVDCHARSYDA